MRKVENTPKRYMQEKDANMWYSSVQEMVIIRPNCYACLSVYIVLIKQKHEKRGNGAYVKCTTCFHSFR